MLVTNGDIVRNMDNQNLAEVFCAIISKTIRKDYLKRKILFNKLDNVDIMWYNENVVKGIKEWLDEPYEE